jgi:hypothetical protein
MDNIQVEYPSNANTSLSQNFIVKLNKIKQKYMIVFYFMLR